MDPSSLTNLAFWLRGADSAITLAGNTIASTGGQLVAAIADKSANGYTASGVSGLYPYFNPRKRNLNFIAGGTDPANGLYQYLTLATTGLTTSCATASMGLIVRCDSLAGDPNNNQQAFLCLGRSSNIKMVWGTNNGCFTNGDSPNHALALPSNKILIIANATSGSTINVYINGTLAGTVTNFNPSATSVLGAVIGWWEQSNTGYYRGTFSIDDLWIKSTNHNSTDITNMVTYAQLYHSVFTGAVTDMWGFWGDSRVSAPFNQGGVVSELNDTFSGAVQLFNFGAIGYTTSQIATLFNNTYQNITANATGRKTGCVIDGFVNDLITPNSTASVITNLTSLITSAVAKFNFTLIATGDAELSPAALASNANINNDIATVNAWIKANARNLGCADVIDTTNDPRLNGTTQLSFNSFLPDGSHYTESAIRTRAAYYIATIAKYLATPTPIVSSAPGPTVAQIAAGILANPANLLGTNSDHSVNLPATATMNITGNLSGAVGSVSSAVTLPASAPAGYGGATTTAIAAAILKTPANLLATNADNSVNLPATVTANISGTITAAGSVTNSVTVGTNNDKTGYALSSAGVSATQSGLASHNDVVSLNSFVTGLESYVAGLGTPQQAGIPVALPATATMNITGSLSGSVGSVASAVTLPATAPAGYGGSSGSGSGPVSLNQNTGGTDALRYVNGSGQGVAAANILIYLATDWPANPANVQAQSITGADGRWLTPAFVSHGTYVAVFIKPNADGPDISAPFTV